MWYRGFLVRLALPTLLIAALADCSASPDPSDDNDGSEGSADASDPPAAADSDAAAGDGPVGAGEAQAVPAPRTEGAASADPIEGLLRADPFSALLFELDAVDGTTPSATAQTTVFDQLADLIQKPEGIGLMGDQTLDSHGADHVWSEEELRTLASETRTVPNTAERVVIHILTVDGHLDTDTDDLMTLGLSWGRETVVLFMDTIAKNCTTRSPRNESRFCDQAVASIWMHELGHLLGLVSLGLPMQEAHEDSEHEGHCDDPNCLMYWAYHRSGAIDRLRDRFDTGALAPPPVDAQCAEDLAAVRDRP